VAVNELCASAISPVDAAGENVEGFGESIALSRDGNTALIAEAGGAWVYMRSGGAWIQQGQKLTVPRTEDPSRLVVALSADGNTAVIAGPYAPGARGGVGLLPLGHNLDDPGDSTRGERREPVAAS
jgi:hypothetical protein